MNHAYLGSILGALVVGVAPLYAQAPHLVFVENSQSANVSIIDGVTLKVIGTIDVGASPDDIVASPKGDVLYLSRIVRSDAGRPTGGGELIAIDPLARTILWRAAFRGSPNHVAVSPDGKQILVTIVSGNYVAIIDPVKHAMVDSIVVGTGPHDVEYSHDGKHIYVGLIRGTDVVEVDAVTHAIIRKIPVGENVRPIAVTRDETRIFIQRSRNHSILVADPRTGDTVRTIMMPIPPNKPTPSPLPVDVNHGLRITEDGKILIANGSIVDITTLYSLPNLTLLGVVSVGRDPNWITLSPDGKRAYVSNRGSDDVSVIDIASHKELTRIKVGKYPQRMTAIAVKGH